MGPRVLINGTWYYTTKSGQQHVNPLLRIASQVQADMLRIGAQFGLTPVGRLRLSGIKPPAGPSKFESDLPLSDLPGSF